MAKIILIFLGCYLIGCINPAYILARIKGFDIRQKGSGNAGASNAVITMGTKVGVFTALFDIFKSFLCYKLSAYFLPFLAFAGVLGSVCCILGHVFPFYLKFRGGKGFASLGGLILAYDYRVFLIMLACAFVLVMIIDYISIITCLTAASFPVIYFLMTREYIGTAILFCIGVVMILKHIPNFKRIADKSEVHFKYVFHKKKEKDRISGNMETKEEVN